MLLIMTGLGINKRITDLKFQGKETYSNAVKRPDPMKKYEACSSSDSVIWLERDHGINRLSFYTINFSDLKKMIEQVNVPLTMDIITKDECMHQADIYSMGFSLLARMRRLVNRDITGVVSKIFPSEIRCEPRRACVEDTEIINHILWNTFDTRISHLLNNDELKAAIEKGEVLIIKEDGEIVTILQRSLDRHQFYINQVINRASSSYIHALMGAELQRFYEDNGRYLYAWVQDTNIASNKFHSKYGMTFDGVLDLVYIR